MENRKNSEVQRDKTLALRPELFSVGARLARPGGNLWPERPTRVRKSCGRCEDSEHGCWEEQKDDVGEVIDNYLLSVLD
jgi:hypothetical protein